MNWRTIIQAHFTASSGIYNQPQFTAMKYETLFIMIRVQVYADHASVSDTVRELENESILSMTDTANINVLETEILVSRIHNTMVHKTQSHQKKP